jgi:uncharacterized metal-binding protein YceD (DUF177 family)
LGIEIICALLILAAMAFYPAYNKVPLRFKEGSYPMREPADPANVLRVAELPPRKTHHFDLTAEAGAMAEIKDDLGLSALRKLRFQGALHPQGGRGWRLEARLGATVEQPCVVTLAPVMTRIDTDVTRHFVPDWDAGIDSDEMEMPEDDSSEPLGDEIDLLAVMTEALALALPDYPRAADAELSETTFAGEGVTPMSDEDARPFAGLAALKDKLGKTDS